MTCLWFFPQTAKEESQDINFFLIASEALHHMKFRVKRNNLGPFEMEELEIAVPRFAGRPAMTGEAGFFSILLML